MPQCPWPALDAAALAPTVEHLHRLVQVAGKYTLDQPFEPGWGNVVYTVGPRGLSTPPLRRGGVRFQVHYRLLDDDVVIEASTGTRSFALGPGSVAAFYAELVGAAAELGIPAPVTPVACEIPGAADLDADEQERPWDRDAARLACTRPVRPSRCDSGPERPLQAQLGPQNSGGQRESDEGRGHEVHRAGQDEEGDAAPCDSFCGHACSPKRPRPDSQAARPARREQHVGGLLSETDPRP